jgi:hypothetical protein
MTLLALYLAAFTYEPHPNDAYRFGFAPLPSYHPSGMVSPARLKWRQSTRYRTYVENLKRTWALPGQEHVLEQLLEDAIQSERAWDKLDDLANSSASQAWRIQSACRLREIIGPVNYYLGRMPEPWPWTYEE